MRSIMWLVTLVACSTAPLAYAQTYISGTISIDTVWDTTGNPYIVTGNTLLANGSTLTINPGVTVRFRAGLALRIDGTLVARGTIADSIRFTSDTTAPAAGDWAHIYLSNSSTDATYDGSGNYVSGSILENCAIRYAGNGGNYGAVRLDGAHPCISGCVIEHNAASGIYANNLTGLLRITNNVIGDNHSQTGCGICIFGGNAIISSNTIGSNYGATNYGGGGIFTYSNASVIANNVIADNSANGYSAGGGGAGIYVREGSATITKNIISKNKVLSPDGEGGGILVYMSTAIVSGNVVIGNVASKGGGVYGYSATQISDNIIAGNIAGSGGGVFLGGDITRSSFIGNVASRGAAICSSGGTTDNTLSRNAATSSPAGTIDAYAGSLVNGNNLFTAAAGYTLYNSSYSSSPDLDATGNWWGTASDTAIQQLIYDWFDDASRGIVDYSPFLAEPETLAPVSPPANPRKLDAGGGSVALSWSPNPEADVAGYRVHYGGFTGHSFDSVADVGSDTSCVIAGVAFTDTFGITAYDHGFDPAADSSATIVNENMTSGHESWYALTDTAVTGVAGAGGASGPRHVLLHQNRPNPFAHETVISYNLDRPARVRLVIYDTRGAVVRTLLDSRKGAGSHSVVFDGRGLPNGVYFCRLAVGASSATRKLVIVH